MRCIEGTNADHRTLGAFEAALRRAGAPVVDCMEPGLTLDQARALTGPFEGISLPQELLTWFGWHNGAREQADLSPKRMYLSLQEVLEDYEMFRSIGEDGPEHRSLLPITNASPSLFVECVPESPTIGRIFIQDFAERPRLKLGSVGELIEIRTAYLDNGVWRYPNGIADYGPSAETADGDYV